MKKYPGLKEKMRLRMIAMNKNPLIRAKMAATLRGRKLPEYLKENLRQKLSGRKRIFTSEWRMNLSKSRIGKKLPLKVRMKMSASRQGNKNPSWQGGISFIPYTADWPLRKTEVQMRDGGYCQICGIDTNLEVHHINYDKQNSDIWNLILLCRFHHKKTNFNRMYWQSFFEQFMRNKWNRYIGYSFFPTNI